MQVLWNLQYRKCSQLQRSGVILHLTVDLVVRKKDGEPYHHRRMLLKHCSSVTCSAESDEEQVQALYARNSTFRVFRHCLRDEKKDRGISAWLVALQVTPSVCESCPEVKWRRRWSQGCCRMSFLSIGR
jgi:hypothetical protein